VDDHGGVPVLAAERLQLVAEVDRVDVVDGRQPVERGVERVLAPQPPSLVCIIPAIVVDEQLMHGLARRNQQEGVLGGLV
jgi:hypothetical protein